LGVLLHRFKIPEFNLKKALGFGKKNNIKIGKYFNLFKINDLELVNSINMF